FAQLTELEKANRELQKALSEIKELSGLLPICSSCKKIRNDNGYWEQIEGYIRDHSKAEFSHSICPDCAKKLYPEFYKARH
ncbi:MAG: sensor with HAMP domain protein, partial [Smithella sp.]|nr:sensor with HAMP domain protein [Smithella sp.]